MAQANAQTTHIGSIGAEVEGWAAALGRSAKPPIAG